MVRITRGITTLIESRQKFNVGGFFPQRFYEIEFLEPDERVNKRKQEQRRKNFLREFYRQARRGIPL